VKYEMAIGEKLWEGKAKSMTTIIKDVDASGVWIMATWGGKLMGMGKAKGMDGQVTFSGKIMMGANGAGVSMGQGLLNMMTGDMAVIKGYGYGKVMMDKAKSIGMWTFMTMSPKLAWMNDAVTLVTLEGDPQWMEFTVTVWEWKW
jgi:hypothetical protein